MGAPTTGLWDDLPKQDLNEKRVEQGWIRINRSGRKVLLRQMVVEDMPVLLDMAQREFGSCGDDWQSKWDNWWLRQNVKVSFRMRLAYKDDDQDHKVGQVDGR